MKQNSHQPHPPIPTARVERYGDGAEYRVWDDGSFRREPAPVRGKAAVKEAKRQRRML